MTALQQRQEALTSANKTVLIVAWYKDAGGTLGYLETRRDIDWSRFRHSCQRLMAGRRRSTIAISIHNLDPNPPQFGGAQKSGLKSTT
jgi:hypothetical protein